MYETSNPGTISDVFYAPTHGTIAILYYGHSTRVRTGIVVQCIAILEYSVLEYCSCYQYIEIREVQGDVRVFNIYCNTVHSSTGTGTRVYSSSCYRYTCGRGEVVLQLNSILAVFCTVIAILILIRYRYQNKTMEKAQRKYFQTPLV